MDRIIGETLILAEGVYFFRMEYPTRGRFSTDPPRSMFIDGEIALMLAVRRLLEEREDYGPLLKGRVET